MGLQDRPIGVFDSGIGGLTVVRQIQKTLPHEDIVYFGDTARVPYGTKSKETIVRFSLENAAFLSKFKIKFLVVACNSSSSYSLPTLRRRFKIPVEGVIRPAVKAAVETTKTGRVGVIGTAATVSSGQYPAQIKRIDSKLKVKQAACPLFVSLAEEGWARTKVAKDIAKIYLAPLKTQKIDTLILGCTHYPLLSEVVAEVMGDSVKLIDSASYTAVELGAFLEKRGLAREDSRRGVSKFFVSDEPQRFAKISRLFLGMEAKGVRKVS